MQRAALVLFTMALGKVALVDGLQRQSLVDAVRQAYTQAAVRACAVHIPGLDPAVARIRVTAGDRTVPVALWQVDHGEWAARYRRATVHVDGASGASCAYDVATGQARPVS
jgi:hypothetical protein